ncbi:hypothetical protein HMPREF1173_01369 [Prevotella nigrescens CC14M]|uniref:Uncharacterized protein n=1 Tax=Prevotella nigrescens CC14M TaxID=1073366 RepID=V8CMS6_9BACT|nr:hypothetical protein HMPREF1173_01369 [Prevotella nigrescens CC14M]
MTQLWRIENDASFFIYFLETIQNQEKQSAVS